MTPERIAELRAIGEGDIVDCETRIEVSEKWNEIERLQGMYADACTEIEVHLADNQRLRAGVESQEARTPFSYTVRFDGDDDMTAVRDDGKEELRATRYGAGVVVRVESNYGGVVTSACVGLDRTAALALRQLLNLLLGDEADDGPPGPPVDIHWRDL